jgi:3-hydroxybutyrate dehydrogenase
MSFNRQTALVTGSTSGIGLAIAKALAASGRNVILTGLGDVARFEELAAGLARENGVATAFIPADLRHPAEVRSLALAALQRFNSVQVLVNNAGIQYVAPIHEYPDEQWDALLAVNLSSAFHATKAILPSMRSAGWGRIINIASSHGLVGSPGKSAYVASKHGLIGLTKVTALENAEFGITANAVCPGWTRTPLAEQQVRDRAARSGNDIAAEEQLMIGEKQAIREFTTPAQIADLAVFLCSDSASSITGASLSIDGGWTAT